MYANSFQNGSIERIDSPEDKDSDIEDNDDKDTADPTGWQYVLTAGSAVSKYLNVTKACIAENNA